MEHCSWTIQATKGNTLSYSFTAFDVEDRPNCDRDYLKVCTQILETRIKEKQKQKKNKHHHHQERCIRLE